MSLSEPIKIDGINYYKWTPDTVENNRILERRHIQSNKDYRQFLTKNANEIIATNLAIERNECSFRSDIQSDVQHITTPYMFNECSQRECNDGLCDLKKTYFDKFNFNSSARIASFS